MKNRSNFWYGGFAALILALCLVPSLGMLLSDSGDTAGGNQVLAAPPSLVDASGQLNPDYLTELTAYVEDSHFLRQEMIEAWSLLNVRALHTSISDQVILGSNGWLYYGETVDDYVGADLLDEREIFSAARNLALVDQYCRSQGAEFLFTIAPNKNSLYDENMPDLTRLSEGRNADALARALAAENVAYLDLFAAFEGQEEVLYFAQDSHWNDRGAALAADAVNAALGRESAYFTGPFAEGEHLGDLYEMLFPTGSLAEPAPVCGGAFTFTYDVPIRSAENQTIMTTGGGEGSLLMFRDSFGNLLYPYLAESFGQALFSRAMPIRLDMIAQREADTVVLELVERNIDYLIRYVPVMPAPLGRRERRSRETAVSWPLPPRALRSCRAMFCSPARCRRRQTRTAGSTWLRRRAGTRPFCWRTAASRSTCRRLLSPVRYPSSTPPRAVCGPWRRRFEFYPAPPARARQGGRKPCGNDFAPCCWRFWSC